MSETLPDGDDTTPERSPSADVPLRRLLATADTSLLATVVTQFWQDRGYRTAQTDRGGNRFVLVRDRDGGPVHLVWVDPMARATPERVGRLARMAASFGDVDATLTSGREYDASIYAAAEEHGVECLASDQLVTLVDRAGLQGLVRGHARSQETNAVADGGATTATVELRPPADHPLGVRAGLVVGGTVLSLLALWGGAAQVTSRLLTCGGDCPLLWGASFLPLLAVLVGSFAVAVGVFD
ncbi:hypothetical protein [Salinigranum salinum]|uniref:hypothetical protein n=1 Tax=Salinigranum salinum TaxID=1364937 RepID=UPI001260A09F|nr:hypothetical protein [Salinigranum salinum]